MVPGGWCVGAGVNAKGYVCVCVRIGSMQFVHADLHAPVPMLSMYLCFHLPLSAHCFFCTKPTVSFLTSFCLARVPPPSPPHTVAHFSFASVLDLLVLV